METVGYLTKYFDNNLTRSKTNNLTINTFQMQIEPVKPLLLKNTWFKQLPDEIIDQLVVMSKSKHLTKGQRLHAKNDPPEGLYCVLKGKIRVSNVSQEGREMVLTWLDPGSWFGEISLFDGLPRTHDAHAEMDTELLLLPVAAFHELLEQRPVLYPHFMRLLCGRIRATFALIDETGGLSLKGQLAKRLLLLANRFGQQVEDQGSDEIAISQETLAHMLNSSRQTVNKLLQELQQEEIIRVHYGQVDILDAEALTALTQV